MATVLAKVVGPNPICDVHTGDYVSIDTDLYDVAALVIAGHVELSKEVEVPEVATIPGEPA